MSNDSNGRYIANNENPLVLCAYGETAAKAFKQMYKLLQENEHLYPYSGVNAVNTNLDDEGTHFVTVYI